MPKTYVYRVLYKGKVIDEIQVKSKIEDKAVNEDDVYAEALSNLEIVSVTSNDN